MPLLAVAGVPVVFVAVLGGGGGARIVRFICVPCPHETPTMLLLLFYVFDNETRPTVFTISTNQMLIVKI